jgi:hypothetical protein
MYFNCRIQSSYTRPFKLAQIHHTTSGCLHHAPQSCPMSNSPFPWSHLHGPISKQCIFKPFGPFANPKPNDDEEK